MLTQFNSASLNRHIAQTYRLDVFSDGFVEVLAAEQTPDSSDWFQGTADAVRQAARHFARLRRRLLPDPRRRPPLPDGLLRADRGAHRGPRRHHHRRAAGDAGRRDADGHLPVRRPTARSSASRRSRTRARLAEIGGSMPRGLDRRRHDAGEAVRRLDGHLRVLARGAARDARAQPGIDFGKRDHPEGARHAPRAARTSTAATGPTSARSSRSTTPTSC